MKISGVHVQPPYDWTTQVWQVVTDDGGLFCNCWYADCAHGGTAREHAELIAKAVNQYIRTAEIVDAKQV